MMTTQLYPRKIHFESRKLIAGKKFLQIKFLSFLFIFLIGAQVHAQKISNVSVAGVPACPGSAISISFLVTNGIGSQNYFTTSTNYIIYYSTGGGFTQIYTFTSATAPSGDGGSAIITKSVIIPSNAPPLTSYRIAIGSTGPNVNESTGGNASLPFTIYAPSVVYSKIFASTCHGGTDGSITVTASGGASPYTYSWTGVNGFTATTPSISNLSLGDYNVVVKDNNLCSTTIQGITIKMANALSVGILKQINPGCAGNDGSINAYRIGGIGDGITPIQFKLDGTETRPYQTSSTFSGLSGGTYTVTVMDSRGCTGVSPTVTLAQSSAISIVPGKTYQNNVSGCGSGSDGNIIVSTIGGTSPYHFILNGVEKSVNTWGSFAFNGLSTGSYTVTVADYHGCSATQVFNINQTTIPVAGPTYKGDVTCLGANNGFITTWQSGGVPGFTYSNDGGITYQGSYRFLNLSAGSYSVVVKDSKGCVSAPVAVTINPGTQNCVTPRIGNNNMSNTSTENNFGSPSERIGLSNPMLNSPLNIQAFPNPFASEFTLNVKGNTIDRVTLTVTDIFGRRVSQSEGYANQQFKLGSNLKNGIYIVQVTQGSNIQTIKIVKE